MCWIGNARGTGWLGRAWHKGSLVSGISRSELADLIGNGTDSGLEFKSDRITSPQLAREMVALLNLEGGHVLLGVEDDGTVTGLRRSRKDVEEWVMEVARSQIQPAIIPFWGTVEWGQDTVVGIVSLPANAPDKPYKARVGSAWSTKVRVGTTTRDATREEEERLYQQSGGLRYGLKPVLGTGMDSLDSAVCGTTSPTFYRVGYRTTVTARVGRSCFPIWKSSPRPGTG